ncbi:MAG: hypothetical protein Q9160_003621 [Pyrenula sp. 1 TL-2023]
MAESSSSKEKEPQRRKIWHPKVKTGCITCKARRVKCTEERPYCQRCKKTGIKCAGFRDDEKAPPKKAAQKPPSPKQLQAPMKSLFESKEDASGFRFTVQTLSVRLQFYSKSQLWDTIIPQASHNFPAVKHAMLALDSPAVEWEDSRSNHKYYVLGTQQLAIEQLGQEVPPAWAKSLRVSSMRHYSQAIKELVSKPPPIDAVLLACLLFTVFENRFLFKERTHVDAGIRLINEYRKRNQDRQSPTADLIKEDIAPIFEGFLLQLLAVYQKDMALLPSQIPSASRPQPHVPDSFNNGFDTFSSFAGVVMYAIDRASHVSPISRPLTDSPELKLLKDLFTKWSKAFQTFCEDNRCAGLPEENRMRMTRAHQRSLFIIVHSFFTNSELAYDEHMEGFEVILNTLREIIESPSPMAQPALTFYSPLFLTATKCRDPVLRRQALGLLRRVHKHEMQWNTCTAADVAERIMHIEERGKPNKSISDHRRIRIQTVESGPRCDSLKISFLVAPARAGDDPQLIYANFPWKPCRNKGCCGNSETHFVQTYSRIHVKIELAAYVSAATVPQYIYEMTSKAVP